MLNEGRKSRVFPSAGHVVLKVISRSRYKSRSMKGFLNQTEIFHKVLLYYYYRENPAVILIS